jgi:D-beta-D-heptose 7-phosphate kinase / D-beta-D-heptose 1-phosphate adenosyltransferase
MKADLRRAVELVEKFWGNKRILVVGDVMLDKYVWGTVDRISPEAPVPVVLGSHTNHFPGGAANVAMNVVGLGAKAIVVGFVGEDQDANTLNLELLAAGVGTSLVSVPGFPTISKTRIVSCNQQMLRLDFEEKGCRPSASYERLIEEAREAISTCSAVVLSDYAKGVLSDRVCAVIINEARTLDIPVLVDPKSRSFEKYRNATTVCPNLHELSIATGEATSDIEKLFDIGERYVEQFGFDYLTVTLGERGIAVVGKDVRSWAPAVARQVFDVSGAGDTVIATLALCLACGVEIEAAIGLANVAAGIVVSKVGTVPIDRNELLGSLSQDIPLRSGDKILPRERLLAKVASWRAAGKHIVFTNGCYDILHVGHISLIEQARQQGDQLIVAINSDDSVKRLKGTGRPMVSEQDRARVLSALAAVDAVVIFDENTPLELIRAIQPNVLVKGGDYNEKTVVGAVDVRKWGGRVCLIPLVEGFGTSKLIAKAVGGSVRSLKVDDLVSMDCSVVLQSS